MLQMWGLLILSILPFCTTGMISAGRMHLYLPLLHHRDYFAPPGFIPILLFCSTGMISAGRMHLYLALLLHRDDFVPSGCISISLFFTTGIISAARMHLYLALLLHKDYFRRPNASLSCSFAPQRLFPPAVCISILLFSSTWMISPRSDASHRWEHLCQAIPSTSDLNNSPHIYRQDIGFRGHHAPMWSSPGTHCDP